ncbi:hypothetical protein U1Q18_003737, partial [Sarracenia purpurea var. burkii]
GNLRRISGVVTRIAVKLRRKSFQRRRGIAEAEDLAKLGEAQWDLEFSGKEFFNLK